jgi:hypothetical protein
MIRFAVLCTALFASSVALADQPQNPAAAFLPMEQARQAQQEKKAEAAAPRFFPLHRQNGGRPLVFRPNASAAPASNALPPSPPSAAKPERAHKMTQEQARQILSLFSAPD